MIEFDDIRAPFDVYIKDMRDGLKRQINKRSNTGRRTYRSNTIATGTLYRSLRTVVKRTQNGLTLDVIGTDYWREADTGPRAGTPAPDLADLARWATAKGVNLSPRFLRYKLVRYGPNRPFSRFASDATPAFIRRLETVMPGALYRDFTNEVDEMLSNSQK